MRKQNIKIGLICIGLEGERLELAAQFHAQAKETLRTLGVDILNGGDSYTLSREEAVRQAKYCRDNGAACIVYLIGTWILANHVVDAIQAVDLPAGVWGIPEPVSFSSVGANVVHGALDEMNIKHRLFYGNADDGKTAREIKAFAAACDIRLQLRGARLGMIGGRTISAYPTAADPNQVKALFGVEIEHVDQLVLLEKAKAVPGEETKRLMEQVRGRYGAVDVAEDMLARSVNVYAALRGLIDEYGMDMCTVKCIGEFMDQYGSCCLGVSMLNDDGFVMGCQCNVNATLSSYIMSFLTDDPVYFGDVNAVDVGKSVVRLVNCGSTPGRLAPGYGDVTIKTQYEYMGAGQGACTLFCCKEGPVTFGTLGRKNGKYVMNLAKGEAFTQPVEELTRVREWAQGFVRLEGDPMAFFRHIRSNHSIMCYGEHLAELREFCDLMDIGQEINI